MIYVGAFPGLWLFMFSCRDMQGHPKQKLPNVILFHCITTNMRGKKSHFFPDGPEFPFFFFCECHFVLLIRKATHMSIPRKQRRTHLPRGHSFSIHFLTDFHQGGNVGNSGQFARQSQHQCSQGKHAKAEVKVETRTVVF